MSSNLKKHCTMDSQQHFIPRMVHYYSTYLPLNSVFYKNSVHFSEKNKFCIQLSGLSNLKKHCTLDTQQHPIPQIVQSYSTYLPFKKKILKFFSTFLSSLWTATLNTPSLLPAASVYSQQHQFTPSDTCSNVSASSSSNTLSTHKSKSLPFTISQYLFFNSLIYSSIHLEISLQEQSLNH
jgi:hypothetical protein